MLCPGVLCVVGRRLAVAARSETGRSASLPMRLESHSRAWYTVADHSLVPRLVKTYRDAAVGQTACDLFLIDGVPAACLLYDAVHVDGSPCVNAIHMNKALIMMFDAGDAMRTELIGRYGALDLVNAATDGRDFLVI